MTLPTSHKIAIIDDKQDEIESLLASLSQKGVSFVYFTGKYEQLPSQPLTGLRIIFSDIDLFGVKDVKTKISTLLNVLKSVISPNNGPYIIVFWTGHPTLVKKIKPKWNKLGFPPLDYISMDKSECKDENGDFSVTKINKKIEEYTRSFHAFNFYLEWENALMQTGESFIAKFHKLVPVNDNWSYNIYSFLYKMYSAAVGKKAEKHSDPEKFIIACQLFNKSFNNELDHGILPMSTNHKLNQSFRGEVNQTNVVSAINHFLWIHRINTGIVSTGDVYIEKKSAIKKRIIDKIIKETDRGNKAIRLAKIVITPMCDIAQNKLIVDSQKGNLHRVVFAIIAPCNLKTRVDSDFWYYRFGPFVFGRRNVYMHIHFGTLGFEFIADNQANPVFSFKQEIVFDIQSKIANHMNRLGNSLLNI